VRKKKNGGGAMRKTILIALVVAMIVASISAATAKQPSDILSLTHQEKKLAWQDLHGQAIHRFGVPWFDTIDRWVLPNTITIKPVTNRLARDVPALAPYDFAIVEGMLLIVNPTDHAVVEVIRPYRHSGRRSRPRPPRMRTAGLAGDGRSARHGDRDDFPRS
jgi:hypothetical protein